MLRLVTLATCAVASLAWQQLPYERVRGTSYNVSYDERAFTINGERQLLHVGAIHYPRATPEMWPHLMQLSRDAGLNVIDTYMFWDFHEADEGVFDFETGRRDFIKFIEIAAEYGLFVQLRIGPYVCAEWSLGGMPAWLMAKDDIVFRTYDKQWMYYMERFTRIVVERVEAAQLMPSQGGPVIFLQIENEYGDVIDSYGEDGQRYIEWCADVALDISEEVPWFMCQQAGAPQSMVETRNGYYADQWLPGHFASGRNQPGAWTENWPGWFQNWGEPIPHRPTEDVSFAVARWFQYGGTLQTYYMWFGGTNWGRSVGGPFIITSYDYDVPLNEFGFPHREKYQHVARLHSVLDSHAEAILQNPVAEIQHLATGIEASVYGNLGEAGSVIFLANVITDDVDVEFNGHLWKVPAWSVVIVDGADGSPNGIEYVSSAITDTPLVETRQTLDVATTIQFTPEFLGPNPAIGEVFRSDEPLSQLPITIDKTDYFWYTTTTTTTQEQNTIELQNVQNVVSLWVNREYVGTKRTTDNNSNLSFDFEAIAGTVQFTVLTMSMGLWNYGPFLETTFTDRGINGRVVLNGADITGTVQFHSFTDRGINGRVVLNGADVAGPWLQQPYLTGEANEYWTEAGQGAADWSPNYQAAIGEAAVWFDIDLVTPVDADVTDPKTAYVLDLSGMGKGAAWVNGHHIGRFWDIIANDMECRECDYRGSYNQDQCRTGCGEPSQTFYHVPREWLNNGSNRVVLFTETGGNPDSIEFIQVNSAETQVQL